MLAFGTAGIAQGLTLGGASTGDNTFNPRITDNGAGVVSVYKADAGLWVLKNSANSYSGVTRIDSGTLRAEGTTLPAASNVTLNGGLLETTGNFTRTVGTGAGQIQWTANASGGFAGGASKLTVNLGSAPTWGSTAGFLGTGGLVLSSTTALSEVDLASGFVITPGVATAFDVTTTAGSSTVNLNTGTTAGLTLGQVISGNANIPGGYTIVAINSATQFALSSGTGVLAGSNTPTSVAAGGFRQITVNDNTNAGTDFATISGVIGSSGAGAVLAKSGGLLNLTGANTYNGNTEIRSGTLQVLSLGQNTGVGTSSLGAWGSGAVVISTSTSGTTLNYVGTGETSSRNIQLGGGTQTSVLQSNGTGALILSNVSNNTAGAKTLNVSGENTAVNEITNVLGDNGGALTIWKTDGGTWILSGPNTYTGQTLVSSGLLGIGADTSGPVGAPTSGPLGVGTLSLNSGSIAAIGADRTIKNPVLISTSAANGFQGANAITIDSDISATFGGTFNNFIAAGKTLTINGQLAYDTTSVAGSATHTFAGAGLTVINGLIDEAAASDDTMSLTLNATGGGTLTISGGAGPNLYNGATTMTAGTLILDKLGAIANTGAASILNLNGGTLQATSVAKGLIGNVVTVGGSGGVSGSNTIEFTNTFTNKNGNQTFTNDLLAGQKLILSGTVNLSESATTGRILTLSGTGDTDVTGLVQNFSSGAGTLTKAGPGVLTLFNPSNSYTGGTTIDSGTLKLGAANVLPDTGTVTVRKTTTAGSTNGVLDLNGRSETIAALTLGSSTTTAANAGQTPTVINSGGAASLTLGGNVTANAGTAAFENGQATVSADLLLSADSTMTVGDSPVAAVDLLLSGTLGESGGARALTKAGAGTLQLSGVGSYTGTTNVNGGTLLLDKTGTGTLAATSALALGGGTFRILSAASGATTQTMASLTVNAGPGGIVLNPGTGTSTTLTITSNTVTAVAGGSVNFNTSAGTPATAMIAWNPALTGGIIGGGFTITDNTGTGLATVTAGKVTRFTPGTVLTATNPTSASTDLLSNTTTTITNTITAAALNSLTIDTGAGGNVWDVVSGKTVTVSTGALLMTGANDFEIRNGTLKSGTPVNSELIVHQYGAGLLTINSVIANGTGTSPLTKLGPGALSLTGINTYTGATAIHAGSLTIGGSGKLGSSGSYLNAITIDSGASLTYNSSATQTLSGTISGAGSVTQAGAGTLTLLGLASSYTGRTTIAGGNLSIGAINNLGVGGASAVGVPTTVANGTIAIGSGGTAGTLTKTTGSTGTTDRVIDLAGTTGGATLDNSGTVLLKFTSALTATGAGSKTLTLQGSASGAGEIAGAIVDNSVINVTSLTKAGTGTWTLSGANTYTGQTTVSAGTLALSGGAAIADAGAVQIASVSGARLLLNASETIGSLNGGSGANGEVALGANTLTVGNATTMTFAGKISGTATTGTVVKQGTGVLNLGLGSVLTFDKLTARDGTTNVNAALGTGPGTAVVTVSDTAGGAGTSLKFGSVSQTLASLTIGAGSTVTFTSGLASFTGEGNGGKGPAFGSAPVVPEPGTLGLLLVGALGMVNRRRRPV